MFTNEEGTRFHRWLIGSRAMAGILEPEDLMAVDAEGVTLAQRMGDIGGDLSRVDEAAREAGDLAAFFELHIEQGPYLYRSGTPIGVVTGITGRGVFELDINGMSNHAGTTPMAERRDALVAASKLVVQVQRMAAEDEICRVATAGALDVQPNAVNVVPGRATVGVEIRDLDMAALEAAERELTRMAPGIRAAGRGADQHQPPPLHRRRAHHPGHAGLGGRGGRAGRVHVGAGAQRRRPRRPGHRHHRATGHGVRAQCGRYQPRH